MVKCVQVGLVGFGMASKTFHIPFIQSVQSLKLVSVSSSRVDEIKELLPDVTVVSSPAEMFANVAIDLVVIATPSNTHAAIAMEALRAGKHVVVDKPFAMSKAEAKEVIDLSIQVGKRVFVFHNRRWDTDFLSVKAAIEEGVVGRVVHFESHIDRYRPKVQDRWREAGGPGSGVWYDLGPHLVDQAVLLFGRPSAVSADITSLREGGKSDDFAHVMLHYDKCRVVLQASMNSPSGLTGGFPRFAVHGTTGAVRKQGADPQEDQLKAGLRPGDAGWGGDGDPLYLYDETGTETSRAAVLGSQEKYYELVADVLLGNSDVAPVSHSEILLVHEIIEAAQESATKGTVVYL